ncbi:hypothetical protein CD351_09385 [Erythrobacter sp. KY5]|uniref:hypothetical protein n=1 Tax=Erythrobacter sp. KY5 TaxID=2011159 RepID=UPI000DBF180F|nr:hypothetical protein [Erythrobacter sp. KY5]AWW74633.1 hypothetical protein CD351_09385 [Erythrobacter sp. KY5]
MKTAAITALVALPLALSACGEATSADAEPMPDAPVDVAAVERALPEPEVAAEEVGEIDSACRANLAEPFVGQTLNLESRTALLDAIEPQAIVRFLEPGEEVDVEAEAEAGSTNPDRLNIRADEDSTITEVFCG